MNTSAQHRFSGNEKSIDELKKETTEWKEDLFRISEEIQFFKSFLAADIFEKSQPNMYERLLLFSDRLESLRTDSLDFNVRVQNHTSDIEGMLECEDIDCDIFYHNEHQKLKLEVQTFFKAFRQLRWEIFNYTSPLLRKHQEA